MLYGYLAEIPPPNNLHLRELGWSHLIVDWNPPIFNCGNIKYYINSTKNCGVCTSITTSTTTTCMGMTIDGQTCNLFIQTFSETCTFLSRSEVYSFQVPLKCMHKSCMHA